MRPKPPITKEEAKEIAEYLAESKKLLEEIRKLERH